jgi:lysophospholipase L1-like esterase
MSLRRGGWALATILLAVPGILVLFAAAAMGQVVTTQVTDTIYRADGAPAGGTVLVSWPAFTTTAGQAVASGSTSATIASGGTLTLQLVPNAGANPVGTYYTAVYHLDDGSVNREYWVVPVSQTRVHISSLRSTVLPTSVAMQTVSKSYVDTAIASAVAGHPLDSSNPYVLKAGDTMTGPLELPGDPATPTQAATKNYVDTNIAQVASGLSQKISTLPAGDQAVAQPAGTQMSVNRLNGVQYASQYQDSRGGNGIANALVSSDCTSGCELKADQTYVSPEKYTPSQWSNGTHVEDTRGGQRRDTYLNPENVIVPGTEAGQVISVTATRDTAAINQATNSRSPSSIGLEIDHQALGGGSNHFPDTIDATVPYFKMAYSALALRGTYNTQGQHGLAPMTTSCYGVGDCLIGAQLITASGGFRDNADEGAHPYDIQVREDTNVFAGVCSSGCTAGSTSLAITPSANPGTQGDGRFLINTNPAKVLKTGSLTGSGAAGPNPSASFSGTSFPVSTFFQTATAAVSQANNVAPGTVTMAIATSGLPTGFASNTASAPAQSGVACVADPAALDNGVEKFEAVNYTVVDGTHLQLTLNRAHAAHATVSIGGLCGYGLEQVVDTSNGIRQIFPVIGSYSSTGLYYAGGTSAIVGQNATTSAFVNLSAAITSVVRSGNTVTLTIAGNLSVDLNGLTLTVAGVSDASYNGSFVVTTTAGNKFTYTQTGSDSSSSGGTISLVTGGYALYPMAEVLSVMNPATKLVDGKMTLAPNTVSWSTSDTVEQPHYYQEKLSADVQFIGQTTPRPSSNQVAGVQYEGNNGPGLQGWMINNAAPATNYYGNGGTHTVPDAALVTKGPWRRTMVLQAGEQAVFGIHCNSHGCGKWNSAYNIFELDSTVGVDTMGFTPSTSALNLNLRGTPYSFTPQAFTAGTINVGTINATTLNGSIAASQLPVFHASGTSHSQGVVPDPGSTAGSTRFLREDGTWSVPAGGTGTTGSAVLPVGASADYSFKEGTGSTVTDASGSGNNAALGSGANAPAWNSKGGLDFSLSSQVALPPALNTTKTFIIGLYVTAMGNAVLVPSGTQPVLISSSMGIAGYNFMHIASAPNLNAHYTNAWSFRNFAGSGTRSTTYTPYSGFHVLAITLGVAGSSVDHFYLDGIEVGSYLVQGASGGIQTTGNLFLGTSLVSPFNTSGFVGTIYRFVSYNTQLTASQVADASYAVRSDIASRGVPVTPQKIPVGSPQLYAVGDSITNGRYNNNATFGWPAHLALDSGSFWTVSNWGVPGASPEDVAASEPNRLAPRCGDEANPGVAVVFLGTNSFFQVGATMPATAAFSHLAGEVQILKKAGCRVFVGTMLSRVGFDSNKNDFDALILSQYKLIGADGLVDFAANPILGADGAYANATYFNTDGTHPKDSGQDILAAEASNALNYYFGYNDANPKSVTALPYSMVAGDGSISLSGLAGAGAITLPDCTGQSGAVYRINNPQNAFAVTVAPLNASQLINGLAFGTSVTVPANSTLTLRDVPNPKSVAGCHWEM